MRKMKKGVALALATAMVLGSSMTVLAEGEGDAPAAGETGTGTTQGAGTSEGHVKKEKLNVVLPTIGDGETPFSYKMDPERLIQETDGGKYAEGTVFPEAASDTGVYFLTAENTYANTSNTLQAINKSSCNITLTVDVQATASADPSKDIPLVATAPTAAETDAKLYLGLKVGNDTQAVSTTKATVTKTISGSSNNFETAVKDGAYVYQEKASASSWKAMNIAMTGAVNNKAITADTTAPTVDVTWKWAKAADNATPATDEVEYTTTPPVVDAEPAISNVTDFTKASPANVVISFTLGSGAKAVDADGATLTQGESNSAVNTSKYEVDMEAKTITIDGSAGFLSKATANLPIVVTLTKGGTAVKTLSGSIVIM